MSTRLLSLGCIDNTVYCIQCGERGGFTPQQVWIYLSSTTVYISLVGELCGVCWRLNEGWPRSPRPLLRRPFVQQCSVAVFGATVVSPCAVQYSTAQWGWQSAGWRCSSAVQQCSSAAWQCSERSTAVQQCSEHNSPQYGAVRHSTALYATVQRYGSAEVQCTARKCSSPRYGNAFCSVAWLGGTQCCAVRRGTLCSTVQSSTARLSAWQHGAAQPSTARCCTARTLSVSHSAVHPVAFGPGCGPCPGLVRGRGAGVSGFSRDTSSTVGLAPWPAGVPGWGGVSGITYDTIDSEEPSSR
jgi:hypothetical protein